MWWGRALVAAAAAAADADAALGVADATSCVTVAGSCAHNPDQHLCALAMRGKGVLRRQTAAIMARCACGTSNVEAGRTRRGEWGAAA